MPKFLVTNGSYFQPFTYDELSKPIVQTVEAHNATQDAYDTLSSGAEALRQYILREPEDSEARLLYDSYMDKLDRLQNNLWQRGYNASSRRDLSSARAGYQSDITRLATAVKDRSERSAAYWDAKHKNPNLVTGYDPGLDSLDDYLRDANHGLNWFSYDSAQFEKDVFDETKARAQALYSELSDPNAVITNPKLKDQLTRVIKKGVTPGEVDAAGILVDTLINMSAAERDKFYKTNSDTVSPIVQMLTESLINRYDATGIRGYDVADTEKQKLINRGKSGLAGGIMAPDIKDFTNPEEEFNMWKRKEQWKLDHPTSSNGSGSGSGSGSKKRTSPGYSLQTLSSYLDSDERKKKVVYVHKNLEKYDAPIPVTAPNGTPDVIESAYDAQRILDDMGRADFLAVYGVDPSSNNPVGTYNQIDGNGKKHTISVQNTSGYAGNGKGPFNVYFDGKFDEELSEQFTSDYRAFRDTVDEWRKNNNNVDIFKLTIPEKEWNKTYKNEGIPDTVPRTALPYIMETKAGIGYRTPAYLVDASTDEGMKKVRADLASSLFSAYVRENKDGKGQVAKTSDLVAYKVDSEGKQIDSERDMRKVLGVNNAGEINTDTIHEISASPEDVIDNRIRFIVTNDNQEYAINPRAFGNGVDAVYRDMRKPVYQFYDNGERELIDGDGIIHYMMKPIDDPVSAFTMSDDQKKDWVRITANTLEDYMEFYVADQSGNVVDVVYPEDIVYSSELRELLRNAVVRYIDDELASPRDAMNQGQMFKATATNPGSTFDMGLTE